MRQIVTGVDADGRSCVVSESELTFDTAGPGVAVDLVFETSESPPPPRQPGPAGLLDLGVAPGLARWMVVEYEPSAEFAMHHTDTVDFDIVLGGSVDLILDDGIHPLTTGDCVAVTGVDHGWRAGPDGCILSVVLLGTPPPD